MFLSLEQWGKTDRKDQRFSDITRAFQHLSADNSGVYAVVLRCRWCCYERTCCGVIAGSDALRAYVMFTLICSSITLSLTSALCELLAIYDYDYCARECDSHTHTTTTLISLLLLTLHEQAVFPRSRIVLPKLQLIRHLLRVFPFHVKETGV